MFPTTMSVRDRQWLTDLLEMSLDPTQFAQLLQNRLGQISTISKQDRVTIYEQMMSQHLQLTLAHLLKAA